MYRFALVVRALVALPFALFVRLLDLFIWFWFAKKRLAKWVEQIKHKKQDNHNARQ